MPTTNEKPSRPKSINDLVKGVGSLRTNASPTMMSYLTGDASEQFEEVTRALEIIREYKTGERQMDLAQASEDCMILAAIHSGLSTMVGYMQGMSTRADHTRRVVKSQYAMAIKQQRDVALDADDRVKITEAEVDHASRALAHKEYDLAGDVEVVSRMLVSSWYAIGDFVRTLNAQCNRAHKEQNL